MVLPFHSEETIRQAYIITYIQDVAPFEMGGKYNQQEDS